MANVLAGSGEGWSLALSHEATSAVTASVLMTSPTLPAKFPP